MLETKRENWRKNRLINGNWSAVKGRLNFLWEETRDKNKDWEQSGKMSMKRLERDYHYYLRTKNNVSEDGRVGKERMGGRGKVREPP